MANEAHIRAEGGLRTRGVEKRSCPEEPLVSVITVVFNGEKHLEQTILSVLAQGYRNIEYIIIDGGSTDGTMEIIGRYAERIDYWVSGPDRGIYDAMNKGIALARGELIGMLNADDYYEPSAAGAVVACYLKAPGPQLLYGNTYFINERFGIRYKSFGHDRYWRGMCFSHQAMFVHSDLYRSVGTYDRALAITGDYDFVVRAATGGVRFSHVDEFLVNYRDSGISARDQLASMREGRRVLRRHVSIFSRDHLVFLGLLAKSKILLSLIRLVQTLFGEGTATAISGFYLRRFIAGEWEELS